MADWLNGSLIGTVDLAPTGADVDTKTLVIDDGGGDQTVTFAPALGRNWTVDEIAAAINAVPALAGVATVLIRRGLYAGAPVQKFLRIMGDPAHTIRADGTANSDLGYVAGVSPADDTVQVIINITECHFQDWLQPNEQWTVLRYA